VPAQPRPDEQSSSPGISPAGATLKAMNQPPAPKIQLINTSEYREDYSNSVQIRVNLWDFLLLFGRVNQTAPDAVTIHNFQGIFVSPQQAKALLNVLQQNVTQYETAFGEIKLEPSTPGGGIVQ
jgi:flagellar protein FlaG